MTTEFLKYLKSLTDQDLSSKKIECINPEHEDKHASMVIYENNAFCFGCGYHIQLNKKPKKENARDRLYKLFIKKCSEQEIKQWAESRGYDIEILKKLRIGKCTSEVMSELCSEVGVPNLSKHKIIQNKKHTFINRIITPFNDYYFSARVTDKREAYKNLFPSGTDKEPYFINGKSDECYITEGETDAIALKHIFKNANIFSIGGTQSFKLLKDLGQYFTGKKIIFCYDNDEAGKKCLFESAKLMTDKYKVYNLLFPPEYKDIDEAYFNKKENIIPLLKEAEHLVQTVYIEDELNPLTKKEYFIEVFKNFPHITPMLDVCVSVMCVPKLKKWSDPVGVNLIGVPSDQKTTLLSFFYGLPDLVYKSDNFTPKAFVSHSNVDDEKLSDIDMLPKMKDKCFLVPELAPIFGARKEDLIENMSIITRVFDGEGYESDTGMKGHRGYKGEYLFTWLGASTPLENKIWKVMGKLGARWFFLHFPEKHTKIEELKKVITDKSMYGDKIKLCRELTHRYMKTIFKDGLKRNIEWDNEKIPGDVAEVIVRCAELLKLLRGNIQVWESQDGVLDYKDTLIEQPQRIINILTTIAKGHAISEGRNYLIKEDLNVVIPVAFSSMPENRFKLFEIILDKFESGDIELIDVEDKLRCSSRNAYRVITEMCLLKLIGKSEGGGYHILPEIKEHLNKLKIICSDVKYPYGVDFMSKPCDTTLTPHSPMYWLNYSPSNIENLHQNDKKEINNEKKRLNEGVRGVSDLCQNNNDTKTTPHTEEETIEETPKDKVYSYIKQNPKISFEKIQIGTGVLGNNLVAIMKLLERNGRAFQHKPDCWMVLE